MSDRKLRSLMHLERTASTARTLNLNAVWKKNAADPDYRANPMFKSPVLNRSIILKHRLRRDELDLFGDGRQTATKVVLPIDPKDLKMGGRFFFVGQPGFDGVLAEVATTGTPDPHDEQVLRILDDLPSLDPFLTREKFRKFGVTPARCYFDLTDADLKRMFAFVRTELQPLIGISFDNVDALLDAKTAKLATKILANEADAEMEPLRLGLGMSKTDFDEGVFCWKGFIYYKWTLGDLLPKVRPVIREIASVRAGGHCSEDDRAYIEASRANLEKAIVRACETVRITLKVYDDAYADLTRNGHPQAFRAFLLRAPNLFYQLGERLGAIHHIVTFWRFRFPEKTLLRVATEDLLDILMDFDASLSFSDPETNLAA